MTYFWWIHPTFDKLPNIKCSFSDVHRCVDLCVCSLPPAGFMESRCVNHLKFIRCSSTTNVCLRRYRNRSVITLRVSSGFPSMPLCFRIRRRTAGQSERAWRRWCRGAGASSGWERATRPRYTTARAGSLCPVRSETAVFEWVMCKRENRVTLDLSCVLQCSIEGAHGFSPRPVDMSNVTLSRDLHVSEPHINNTSGFTVHIYICVCVCVLQTMAELLAENYHNIWAQKKKLELESKGVFTSCAFNSCYMLQYNNTVQERDSRSFWTYQPERSR